MPGLDTAVELACRPGPEARRDARDDALLALAGQLRQAGYHFVTVTPETHRRVNALNPGARTLRDVLGWSRPFDPRILPEGIFALMQEAGVVEPAGALWKSRVRLSSLAGELFFHSAYPTTDNDSVFFGPDTYRFVAPILDHLVQGPRIGREIGRAVDIGCGAGPAGILIARAAPEAEVVLADINHEALRLSRINARLAGTPNAIAVESDLLAGVAGDFDLIVANPPYMLDPAGREYRHGGGALGEGLSVAIAQAGAERLAPGGTLLLYTGVAIVEGRDPFLAAITPLMAGLDWHYRELDPDVFGEELDNPFYARADRIAAVLLTATRQR